MEVKDKVVVVTGASSGIGKSLCERFANEGASGIVASDIDSKGLTDTVESIALKT